MPVRSDEYVSNCVSALECAGALDCAHRTRRVITGERGIEAAQRRLAWEDAHRKRFIYEASGPRDSRVQGPMATAGGVLFRRSDVGLLFEFGVYKAKSFNFFADLMLADGDVRTLFGFDSFSGFFEQWGGVDREFPVDHFDQGSRPPACAPELRACGWFYRGDAQRVSESHSDPIAFIHIDTDTRILLRELSSRSADRDFGGGIIIFDELLGYANWRNHEFKHDECSTARVQFLGFRD